MDDVETMGVSVLEESDGSVVELKNNLLNLLEAHKAKKEEFPKVFDYGEKNFERFDQITIVVLDDEATAKLDGIADKYSRVRQFLQNDKSRGLFMAGFDVVLVKKGDERETEEGVDPLLVRAGLEAAMVHELAHASAGNVAIEEAENGLHEATRFGLQELPEGQDMYGIDSWKGTLLEEGFAQHHFGNYIREHYMDYQVAAINSFLGEGFLVLGEDVERGVVLGRKKGDDEDQVTQKIVMDIDLALVDGKRVFFAPPSFAGMVYRHLLRTVPDFEVLVKEARGPNGNLEHFWQVVGEYLRGEKVDPCGALYQDPFNSGNSFKDVAFECLQAKEEDMDTRGKKTVYVN